MRKVAFCTVPALLFAFVILAGCAGAPADNRGLKSPNSDVRRERALALGLQHPRGSDAKKQMNQTLIALGQSDSDPLVRSAALASLQKQDKAVAQDLAIQLAIDSDSMVRWDAMKILAGSADPRARAALLFAVRNDSSADVRREAVRGLANFDDDEVVKLLIQLLGDPDPGVVVASCRSLQHISGLSLGTRSAQWQEWFETRARVPAPLSSQAVPAPAPTPESPAQPQSPAPEVKPEAPPAPTPPPAPAPAPEVKPEAPPTPTPAPTPAPDVNELERFRR